MDGACGLVWSMLVALGAIDPGSNPGRPTIQFILEGVPSPIVEPFVQGWHPLVESCPRRRDGGRVMTAPRRSMTAALVGS